MDLRHSNISCSIPVSSTIYKVEDPQLQSNPTNHLKCPTKLPTTQPAHHPAALRSSHSWKTSTAPATQNHSTSNTSKTSPKMRRSLWDQRKRRVNLVRLRPLALQSPTRYPDTDYHIASNIFKWILADHWPPQEFSPFATASGLTLLRADTLLHGFTSVVTMRSCCMVV